MQSPVVSHVLRFGVFEADLHTRELRKQGMQIKLQEQPFQVLAFLLEHAGEIVTREQLRQKLWPTDTFVDVDNSVNAAINRLREALGDSAESPRFVETLPRRGYRFVAPVTEVRSPEGGSASKITNPAALALAVILVVTSVWAWEKWRTRSSALQGSPHITSLAVLPLENLSGDATQEYLVDGITDALTTNLAQSRGIRVISRTSAMHYKGTKKTLPEIAQELHVDAVVEGSVSRSKDGIYVTAQLIDASTDRHLWARSYDVNSANIPSLQIEIAGAVVKEIGATISPETVAHLAMAQSADPEAYDLYLRAEPYYGVQTREATDEAMRLLERSVAIDPEFAAAYAALAATYHVRGVEVEPDKTDEWSGKAMWAVQRSRSLDPNLAEAYVSRGNLLWSPANNWADKRAVGDYRHALSLNPNLAEAHHQIANVYNHVGLLEKGESEIQKAVELDPLNVGIRFRVGVNLLYQGKYEDSLATFRDSEKFSPPLWTFQTGFALQHLGRLDEAQRRLDLVLAGKPEDRGGYLTALQALLAATRGDAKKAESKIREALAKGKGFSHFHHITYAVASSYALMNKPQDALRYLRMAADDGFPCYPLFEHDSNLDNLRSDPRFQSFMAEQKRQWEYFRAHL